MFGLGSTLAGEPELAPARLRRITRDRTYINGLAYHHPERVVTNFDLMKTMDTSDEWILGHTGIRERRYAPDDMNTSDLGAIATGNALKDARLDPSELDALICVTSTPDMLIPSTASYIANKLGLRGTTAFDVNAACAGFVYGLAVAQGLLHSQGHDRIVLCAAEKYTRVIDPTDRANSIFWGDGSAAMVLQPGRPLVGLELLDVSLSNYNEEPDLVRIPIGGCFEMSGRAVKAIAFDGLVASATAMLARHDLSVEQLRGFVCHQANLRMIEALADRLGVEEHQHWHNVEMFGNQGAAGALTAFCAGLHKRRDELQDGDLFMLTVYGAGFTGGSALLRWIDDTHDVAPEIDFSVLGG
jgi:3-oxoacyl-[acyl-carrier-protein] synthase III